jgi:hypothetical protein
LVATDFRAALPALRTVFLALLTLIASLSLASQAGRLAYILPVHLVPSFREEPKPTPAPQPLPTDLFPNVPADGSSEKPSKPPPPPPPPPPEDEKPLPPPEDVLPPPS